MPEERKTSEDVGIDSMRLVMEGGKGNRLAEHQVGNSVFVESSAVSNPLQSALPDSPLQALHDRQTLASHHTSRRRNPAGHTGPCHTRSHSDFALWQDLDRPSADRVD